MNLLVKGGRVVDPASGRDAVGDVAVADGCFVESLAGKPERVLDAKGLVVAPGLVDLAARLREPGYEYRATLESEMAAAAAGGVTRLAVPPDTDPPLDEPGLVDMLRRRAQALSLSRVHPVGALTVKLEGRQLTEMAELAQAGCVAFSQADAAVADTQVLWRAMQYAATFGFPVWLRAEEPSLAKGGVAHDGEVATRMGLAGIPAFAETIAMATLLELVRATGARLHVCRISSAAGVAMLRRARHDGLPITCDVGMHHVHLSDMDLGYFDSQCRLQPPLRSGRDRDALRRRAGRRNHRRLVSDHTPVDEDGKHLPFAEAEPGATGLELLLPLTLKWGMQRKLQSRANPGARHQRPGAHPRGGRRAHRAGGAGGPGRVRPRGPVPRHRGGAAQPGQELAVPRRGASRARARDRRRRAPRVRGMRAGARGVLVLALLAGCSSAPERGGGYYKDDGPGGRVPDLAAIPDAVPRAEPLNRYANRPYERLGKRYVPLTRVGAFQQRGVATWYGRRFQGGSTSSGESYDMYKMTAAHPILPIPSYARVTNLANGRTVIVRINDRGPFHAERIIDLSYAAAYKLGYVNAGSARVLVEQIVPGGTPLAAQ